MSKERINKILDDSFVRIEGSMRQRIINAMKIYGKEQYKQGCINIIKANRDLELDRLRQLVQAQKELMELYRKWAHDEGLTRGESDRLDVLRNQIKRTRAMKGILFKPEMIKAIMEGKKTQTRRIIKSNHKSGLFEVCKRKIDGQVTEITSLDWNDRPKNGCTGDIQPKYKVGEVIYVKEPYTIVNRCLSGGEQKRRIDYKVGFMKDTFPKDGIVLSEMSKEGRTKQRILKSPEEAAKCFGWENTMFMPASAARIFLEITKVRVEQLGEITGVDILKEGIGVCYNEWIQNTGTDTSGALTPVMWDFLQNQAWQTLWTKINKSYDPDQWLFVYEFKVVDKP